MPGTSEGGSVAFVGAVALMAVAVGASAPAVTGDPTTDVLVRLCLVAAVVAGAVVVFAPMPSRARAWLVATLVGTFLCAGAALVLSGSDFPPLGVALDQAFRSAAITKYAHTWALVDFAYKDLPAFYPPLFFWVLGRTAAVTGVEPYEALKLGLLAVALVAPLCALALWSRITRDAAIVIAVVVATFAFQDWYEPYAWLAVVVFVPWWIGFVLQVGPLHTWSTASLVVGALIGGALVCTYYYFFFVGAVQLLLLVALRRPAALRALPVPPRDFRRIAIVLGGAAVVSAVYWLPLFVSIGTTPGARSMQNRYYDPKFTDIPLRFFDFDLVGWIMLIGLVYLAVTMLRSQLSLALATLVGAAYGWFVLGYVGVLVDVPLLASKVAPLIDVALLAGAALSAVELGRAAITSARLRARLGEHAVGAGLAAVAVVAVLALGEGAVDAIPYLEQQRAASEPSSLLDTFERATRGRSEGTVVLTDQEQLPAYVPVYVFNVWNAHYSHPASEFDRRTRFLERLAAEDDPAVFAAALAHNRYDRVDSVALRPDGAQLPYAFFDDAFPRGVTRTTITFHTSQFDDAFFTRRGSASLAVFLPRSADPLAELDAGQRRALRRHFAGHLDD